eukprot:15440830-Alexandrium_andersonii.AAC.1
MAGPLPPDSVASRFGPRYNAVRRFGIEQGCKPDGSIKYRRIDDHSETTSIGQPAVCKQSHGWGGLSHAD